MKEINFLGRSAVALYLVCLCLAVVSYPASADECVGAGCDVAAQVAADQLSADAIVAVDDVDRVDAVLDRVPGWVKLASLITATFSVIAAATPTPKDDGVLAVVRKVVDWLSFNIGNAKPAAKSKDNWLK